MRLCKRCNKYGDGDKPIMFIDEENKKQSKRFGSIPCGDCMTEIIGGEQELKKLQSIQILKEMKY